MANSNYKRRWRNLLLDWNYQLRFILTSVIVAGLLMAFLGYWVLRKADIATDIAMNRVDSVSCSAEEIQSQPELAVLAEEDAPKEPLDDPFADKDEDEDTPKIQVTILESNLEIVEPEKNTAETKRSNSQDEARAQCLSAQATAKEQIVKRQNMIRIILWCAGFVLLMGLFFAALKMTHRVAGPLFKISSVLARLEKGQYETIYNLRKGDRLVDFFELFKEAYGRMRLMHEEDRKQMQKLLGLVETLERPVSNEAFDSALSELKQHLAAMEGDHDEAQL